jgi:hypothetical protein
MSSNMHESILASSSQSTLLGFLVWAPRRSYTLKELKTRLRLTERAASLALSRLAKLGFVKTFRKGGQKFFLLNAKNGLLPEWRRQLTKPRARRDDLAADIAGLGDIRHAFLSGIFTGQPQLPVDLLLVGKVNLRKLDDFLSAYNKQLGIEINYSIMSVQEFKQRRDTFDRFIKDIFDYPHVEVSK